VPGRDRRLAAAGPLWSPSRPRLSRSNRRPPSTPRPAQHPTALQENALFSQLFLCLSRACLGKTSIFKYRMARKRRFRTGVSSSPHRIILQALHRHQPCLPAGAALDETLQHLKAVVSVCHRHTRTHTHTSNSQSITPRAAAALPKVGLRLCNRRRWTRLEAKCEV
jgi:hypothetical protein